MGTKKIKTYKNKTRKNKKPSKNPIKILKNLINPKNTKKVPKDEIIKEHSSIDKETIQKIYRETINSWIGK